MSAEPQAPAVTFLAGQPMLMSTIEAPTSTAIPAARARASGSRPKIWTAKRRPSRLGHIRPTALAAPRVSASAERNSVKVSAAPSSSQIVRNGRSVTASIGARSAPGLSWMSPMRMRARENSIALAGIVAVALGTGACRRAPPTRRRPVEVAPRVRRRCWPTWSIPASWARGEAPADAARAGPPAGDRGHRSVRAGVGTDVAAGQHQRRLLDAPRRDRLGPRRRPRLRSRAGRSRRRRQTRHHRHAPHSRQGGHPRQPRAVRPDAHARRSARPAGARVGVDRCARPARAARPRRQADRADRDDLLALPRRGESDRRRDRAGAPRRRVRLRPAAGDGGRARRRQRGGRRIPARPRISLGTHGARAAVAGRPRAAGSDGRVRARRDGARLSLRPLRGDGARAAADARPGQPHQRADDPGGAGAGARELVRLRGGGRALARAPAGAGRRGAAARGRRRIAGPFGARCSSTCATSGRWGCSRIRFPGCSGPTRSTDTPRCHRRRSARSPSCTPQRRCAPCSPRASPARRETPRRSPAGASSSASAWSARSPTGRS